jgi:hypothetical protein
LGESGDIPIPGDYVGEGKVLSLAAVDRRMVLRPSAIFPSCRPVTVGGPDDTPLAGSLGGTGIFEVGVWVPPGRFLLANGFSRAFG